MNWGKTAHGLVMEEEASIKAFIKKNYKKQKNTLKNIQKNLNKYWLKN